MNIEAVALKGNHEWYEDATVYNKDLQRYGVIDGATSLDPYRGKNGETGAYLAACIVKKELEAAPATNESIREAALRANQRLNTEMKLANVNIEEPSARWSCALACVQISPYHIEYVQAGDCMIVAKYKNGHIRVLTHDQVAAVGEHTLALYKQYKAKGIYSHAEIIDLLKPTLVENRKKANERHGYSVLNGQPSLANYLEYGAINKNGLEAVYIMSDGMFLPSCYVKPFEVQWIKTIALIDELSLSGYADWLLRQEQEDRNGDKHMRMKVSDDKTALKLTL